MRSTSVSFRQAYSGRLRAPARRTPSLREWLAEEHLAFFVSDIIDAMDLSGFDARCGEEGPGNQAFDPRMMVRVLVYAYATGTFSSWKIAAKLHEDVALRVLGADNCCARSFASRAECALQVDAPARPSRTVPVEIAAIPMAVRIPSWGAISRKPAPLSSAARSASTAQ